MRTCGENLCTRWKTDLSKMQKRKNDSCTGGRTSQNPFLKEERKRKMREKERKLLLFAGTTEGRMLAEYLSKKRIACYVSTATEYGKSLLQEEQLSDIIILARLHSAVIAYARDFMINRGFTYCVPPFMIRSNVVTGVMSFAEMDAMMYKIEGEDLYLIGTSEHSMIGKFIGTTLDKTELLKTLRGLDTFFRSYSDNQDRS